LSIGISIESGSAGIRNFLQDPDPEREVMDPDPEFEVMDPDPELDLTFTKIHKKY
jgi:hypothetical protein